MKILITGMAGFIGYHTAKKALALGHQVVGIDNLNAYYSVELKIARLLNLGLDIERGKTTDTSDLIFKKIDIADDQAIVSIFQQYQFDIVIHLAAQAGVRYSITNPKTYIKSNAEGFLNILEACRNYGIKHLIYASSSSVYGESSKVPFTTKDPVDHPISLYAATKRSNELMAHTYSHLYGIPSTGLRFFTVYGPWGRPDMAPFIFAQSILQNKPIKVFNQGQMERDFIYVDDIVDIMLQLMDKIPDQGGDRSSPNYSDAPYRIYNIGNSHPIHLMDFIQTIERKIGKEALKIMMPNQPGDVSRTYADVKDLLEVVGFRPTTTLAEGINHFVDWLKKHYNL